MNPVVDLLKAVFFPFKALFIVAVCWIVNAMTSPGQAWWHWVAFGLAIATVVNLMRGLRALVVVGGVAGAGYLLHRWWTRREADKAARSGIIDA